MLIKIYPIEKNVSLKRLNRFEMIDEVGCSIPTYEFQS